MRLLIVGNGGREHALLHVLSRDAPEAERWITIGNGGTTRLATSLPIAPDDCSALAEWADAQAIDLAIVGPEAPLAHGIRDHFARRGVPVFAPSAAAARIESSKAYAKALMQRAGVPGAAFERFTDLAAAQSFIRAHGAPIVIKASGLAAGKGVIVCDTVDEAINAARAMLAERAFGAAGDEIVIEEFLEGEELSVFALTDGEHALLMPASQDHKRIGEGDTGPNTGGMGAYTPVSVATPSLMERVEHDVFLPTLAALRDDDAAFRGLLYAGLMLTADGPRVIEFNARFGDPETQALLPMLRSSLLDPLLAVARGDSLAGATLDWVPGAALTTVLAADGYPGAPRMGDGIRIPPRLEARAGIRVFHAGTALDGNRLVTAGGRVLAVTAVAPTLAEAAARSREAASLIEFTGKYFRADIGWRELARVEPAAH
jgi:phosphoribosylamine--glycine ligase